MTIVTDPDTLDRFQVAVDPIAETISIRGLDTERHAVDQTGDSAGTVVFTDAGANFTTDGVVAGDILTIISDPADDGGIIGHYIVDTTIGTTTLEVTTSIPASTGADLTYKINLPEAIGQPTAAVADGVTMQALYSFLKEEWRTLDGGLGNAEDLIQYTYPIESITSEQFEIGGPTHSGWDFADQTTKDLIRTGGWQKQDTAGNVIQDYAGIITLGSLDSDAQVYYQQHAVTAAPTDFVLTGVVNQSINTFDEVTGPFLTTEMVVTIDAPVTDDMTLTRSDGGGDFLADGYVVGGSITVRLSAQSANNGTWVIRAVSATVLSAVNAAAIAVADDLTLIAAVNKRSFLKLFVRKKAKSYAQSEISDIGVATLVTIVNRFPLTHSADPAILLDDGQLTGDGVNTVYQAVSTVDASKTDGVTSVDLGGTFTLTSATSAFTTTDLVLVGDTMELTDSAAGDDGVYEISNVAATILTCFVEPTRAFTGGESARAFTTRTSLRSIERTDGVLTDVSVVTGTLASAASDFVTDGVVSGDMVIITTGTGGETTYGVYKVISRDDLNTLTLDTTDQLFDGDTGQTFTVHQAGMHLQFNEEPSDHDAVTTVVQADISFADADPDTITRGTGNWITDGYEAGMAVTVSGTTSGLNDGTYIVDGVAATILTLNLAEVLVTQGTGPSVTVVPQYGFVRPMNSIEYPFGWRLFGNGATLAQAFQFIQREMRRTTDIDEANTIKRGDVNNLLMSFTAPNGIGLNLFIDDLAGAVLNNTSKEDLTGTSRTFAFIAGITITLNSNITTDDNAKVVVFFSDADGTPANGDEFGTNGAIIVQDDVPTDMTDTTPLTSPLSFNFDYDNNAQGGRTPGTDADVTIVCIGENLAQYVQVIGTIARQSDNSFALVASLERNYSNP